MFREDSGENYFQEEIKIILVIFLQFSPEPFVFSLLYKIVKINMNITVTLLVVLCMWMCVRERVSE
jgi:hypothetical protein